jgi:hypothetical protein
MSEFKIATFGCWNMGCKKYSGQESVRDLLKSKQSVYEFMVILGDNYYANSKKIDVGNGNNFKIKETKLIEAKDGFMCLDSINLEKKLIMGNHDIKDSYDKSCSILKNQLKLQWYDVKFPYAFDIYYVKNEPDYSGILMIYLDTTIYDKDIKKLGGIYCIEETLGKNLNDLKCEQNKFIVDTLEFINVNLYKIKNVIFYGHQPLIYSKKINEKTGNYVMNTIDPLLDLIFDQMNKYTGIKFYWICADYHVYLNTRIIDIDNNNYIDQWIFGTGGGDLDSLINETSINYQSNYAGRTKNFSYQILENNIVDYNDDPVRILQNGNEIRGASKYGYGEITLGANEVLHKFITSKFCYEGTLAKKDKKKDKKKDINGDPISFANKYVKYKNKYMELKKKYIQ